MSDPKMIRGIQEAVSIPVMAKCRIGHFVEAQILEAIEIDYIDESEVLSPAGDVYLLTRHSSRFRLSRCERPGRGAAPDRGRCFDDPYQGRAGNGRCRTGSPPYACDEFGDPPGFRTCVRMSFTRQQNS